MSWKHVHEEEARATDYDKGVNDLRAVAPPCDECGSREAVEDGLCGECGDGE